MSNDGWVLKRFYGDYGIFKKEGKIQVNYKILLQKDLDQLKNSDNFQMRQIENFYLQDNLKVQTDKNGTKYFRYEKDGYYIDLIQTKMSVIFIMLNTQQAPDIIKSVSYSDVVNEYYKTNTTMF